MSANEKWLETFSHFLPSTSTYGIDEVVERIAGLGRIQHQVAAHGELHAIHVMCAEEIILLAWVLPGFGDIYRNPSVVRVIELGPAVVTGNVA